MANITPTVNVTPEEQKKYVTDPELLKELNSVGTPKSSTAGYVTDPELLNQLNAPAQPKIQQQSLITPEMLQGKAAGPGDTSLADFLVHPIDTLTGKDKVSEQNLSDLVAGQEPAGGSHPFLASAAKGVMNFKSMVNDSYISEILPLIEDHKRQYGLNYERATPEQRQDFLNSEAELARHFNKKAEYEKDIQAVTKKYGTDDFSKKADSLYSKPEFQNASTLHQFQMYGDLVLSHPKDIPGHIASVSLESLPTSLTSIVAATMARFMGTGPTGAMMAGGGASGLTEFASEYVDRRQQGDSHEEATMKAGVKSTLIGNMDARSFDSAGKALDRVMGQVDKGIIKRVLSTAKETAKELNKQGMYGAAGEVLGSIASGQKVDPRAALDEYFGELATGPLEALTTYRGKLAEEQAAGAPPAPPGTPPPGGGAPPTPGAINDTEFDQADIPGTPPTTPPPPATPAAEPEKTLETNQAVPIAPELQAKVNEYSELLKKYDPVAYTHMMADMNNGLIQSEDSLKEYKRSYDEIVKARQKRAELEQEKNDLAKDLIATDYGRSLNIKWDKGEIKTLEDLQPFRDLVREKATRNVLKAQMAPKSIEDKAVEKEARELQSEISKYNPSFAEGMKSAIDKGSVQTSEDLDFYKRRLQEYKTRSGEEKSTIKETYGWKSFYDDEAELADKEKTLANAPQSIKDKVAKADQLIQKIADKVNEAGYSMVFSGEAPDNIRNLQRRASGISGTIAAVLNKSKAIQKNYKRANPERLDQRLSDLEEEAQGSVSDLNQVDVTSMKLNKLLDAEIKTATQEGRGQDILDKLSEDNITPKSVANKFWDETYFKLPAETQSYFRKYLNKLTSFKPGSVLAVDREGNSVIAKDWIEVGKDHAIDLGNDAEKLEGTERGYVALMDEANRRMAEKKEAQPKIAALKVAIDDYVTFKEPVIQYKGNQPFKAEKTIRGRVVSIKPNGDLELKSIEGYYTKPVSEVTAEQKEAQPEVKDKTKQAVRYDPSTDKYTGNIKLGDIVSDGKDNFIVTRRSGYLLEVDKVTPEGRKVYGSINVDPTSTEFKGDLYKVAEAPKIEEKKPEVKEPTKLAQKEAEPEVALPTKGLPKDIQARLERLHRLATLAEKKVMDKPLTMDDVVNAYNRVEDSKKEENLANTEKNFTKQAEDKLLLKIEKEYVTQFQSMPPKKQGLIAAIKNGSLDISKQEWAKDAYDLFKIKQVKAATKLEGVSDPVAEQLKKFNAGDYRMPEKVRGTKDESLQMSGTPSAKYAEEENERNFKVYEEAAKLFLEGPLDAKPEKIIETEGFKDNSIQPQLIEKKSADKAIANAEEQNKVISEIIDKKDVRYYLGGILIDRENDRMVTCDGHRATILKKPDYSSVPNPPEKTTGDLILKDDGTWIDGKYPAIDRIIPESHADNKITVNAKDIADYARGIEKANKFLKSDEVFSIFLQNPDAVGTFNAKFIRQMGDLFRRFGYKDIILSLDEGKKLFATSPDGKLSHIVMGIRSKNEIFKTFSKIFKVEKAKGARGDGQTIEAIKDRIIREFGRSVQQLFKDGLIVVVNSVNELEPKYQNELDRNDKAFFDKETGVAYIIADRVSAGDVRSVVLHEVGEHYGLRGMLGEKVYNEQLKNLKKQKDRDIIVAKAWEHVTKNYANLLETDEMQFLREVMARIGENAPTHNLFQRIKTAIKAFLVKKGIIKNLTGEELQDLVMRSLHTVVKGRRVLSSGTGLESARGPSDPDAKRELDDEFRANDVPDAPFNNQKDIADKLTENIGEAKKVIRDVAAAPKQSGIKMISGVDKALTTFRVKNVFFGAGIEETEAKKYAGKLIDAMGKAVASVSLTNAIHAGHIAANVMELGKLTFNQATQMFQAVRSQFAMSNVFKLERKLFKKLGKQTATNLINTFFEAKRARSIQNEYLNREAELERAINDGEDPEVAQRNYESIVKAYKKIPEYFQRRNANGDLMFTDVIENGEIVDQLPILNDDVIDDYIRKDQDFPELKEMMENWTAVNHNMIDNMVFAGIMSEKRGAYLKSIKDYVPWFRVQDDSEELHAPSSFVAGLTNISKERVFRKGAVSARIDNMIDNMVYNVMMMSRNSIRNYSALQIAKAYATRKPNGKLQVFPKEGVMPDGAVRTNILVNGRRIIIEIKDPNHAAALMGLENLELPILDTLSSFSQGLRRGVTTNPFFQWWQVWKDAPTAAAVTGLKSPLKIWGRILGSFFMALNYNDPIVQTLKSYGIGGFQSSGRTAEKEVGLTRGKALMNIGPWILDILDHIGDASDYAQRRIIYQEVLKQGGTETEALFRANAVIDFLRHGNSKAALGLVRTVTFMNAYIQQIDVLATSMAGGGFKGMDRKKARERFRRTTYTLIATGLIYCMMKGGDDDYEKLDDQTKMRNFIIGDMKIPINTSYGFMFKALPEMIYNYIIKHGTKNAIDETRLRKALCRAAFDSLLGPNPIATGLKAPVEILLNHDFFTGGTVTPKGMETLDVYMQYTSSTSNLGKLFSHLTLGALSPIEADHLMRGLFGTVGSTAGWLSDMFTSDKPERVWARNPVIGQMFLPPEPRGREDLFYDLKKRSDEAYNTWETMNKRYHKEDAKEYFKENKSLIRTHDYITNAEAGLKEINAEIRRMSDDPRLTPTEKRKRITYFQRQKNNILESVNQERLRAEK